MIEVDLHLHTTCSDGTLTPKNLVRFCGGKGLKVIAVSDHDSTEGILEAKQAAEEFPGMKVIPAIEMSTDVPGAEIHILGYFVDYLECGFQKTLRRFREGREDRARAMVRRLRELGVTLPWERVEELADGGSIGRPHIAKAMVEAGYIKYPRDAFDQYIGRNGPAYVGRTKLEPQEAVQILLRNGALPVIAHPTYVSSKPGSDNISELRPILSELKASGLVGMEVYYGDYSQSQVSALASLANELDLIACGGSDYHASGNPDEPEPGMVGPPIESYEALLDLKGEDL
jgi:predicted metal-dependent phosphoesterase TrpH